MRILIATPAYDGKVSAQYLNSMLKLKAVQDFQHVTVCYDALIQRARNDIFKIFIESDCDVLVMIDADQGFEPEDLLRNLPSPAVYASVYAAPIRKRSDKVEWNVVWREPKEVQGKYASVDAVGTGFMVVRREVAEDVWNMSPEYDTPTGKGRMVFNVGINQDNQLVSEDIMFCHKVKHCGYDILVDADSTVTHYGPDGKGYHSNFREFVRELVNK